MISQEVIKRLSTIEGHIRGVKRMVQDETYCIDIIRQIQAVQAALNRVSSIILENHLKSCATTAIRGDDPGERERVLKEITEIFDASLKII
jgi:DNA-binding FrmR family transcriptional regulator